ncbi:hypothetical protein [Kitasatospora sp. MAP5-34]|uniref:hypothetical protein n=1 Tax=Kitasatospora sp. MAP5-34 TaxID=3035102 RepID=UPI00247515D6|nr:hypothetical protein [Kitasatospora sp. MAP5-34]MDH6574739.1 hypothetical protein [Kitasatospora sp. MAP5-34]
MSLRNCDPCRRCWSGLQEWTAARDFELVAARIPAVRSGLPLDEADLELQLACVDQQELREVVAGLRQGGAARVQVELVLRRRVRGAVPLPVTTMARSAIA